MSIKTAVKYIMEGKLDQMKSELNTALSEKAVQKLEEKKVEIAKNYFGQSK